MNLGLSFLQEILHKNHIKQTDLASRLSITDQAISNWDKQGFIPEKRVSQIAKLFNLNATDIDRLLGNQPLHFSFRTRNGLHITEEQVSERMRLRTELIYERFFGSAEKCNYELTSLRAKIAQLNDDFMAIAKVIRDEFTIRDDSPLNSEDSITIQERLKARAFFLPFKQINLNINGESEQTAVLFSKQETYSILVDSDRTVDEAHFDKLHELIHIFFIGIMPQDKKLEDLIDKICGELIYPQRYIIEKFFNGNKLSRPSTDLASLEEKFLTEHRSKKFLISPKGLALAIRDSKLVSSEETVLFSFLESILNPKFKSEAMTFSTFGKMDFDFSNRASFLNFYSHYVENKDWERTYPLFEKIKNDVITGALTTADLADTFNLSLKDAVIIKSLWKKAV